MFTPAIRAIESLHYFRKLTNAGLDRESTLTLLMTRVLAYDAHDTLATDDFAVAANALH
jgi:hypothetical protein